MAKGSPDQTLENKTTDGRDLSAQTDSTDKPKSSSFLHLACIALGFIEGIPGACPQGEAAPPDG